MRPRIPNSGPLMTLTDLWSVLGDFFELNSRSASGTSYTAAASVGPTLAALTPTALLVAPTQEAPAGYEWALRAEFTGNCKILAPSNNSLFVQEIQVRESPSGAWQQLSETESGASTTSLLTASVPAVGQYESFGLHCTRALAALPDPTLPIQQVRVAWGIQGVGSSALYLSNAEGETGGWDFTVKWVLQPEEPEVS